MKYIKFAHINIIAVNWKSLARFYMDVFKCEAIYPERNLSGKWMDRLTGISEVVIRGIHLKLPGFKDGPTLEIFEYPETKDNQEAIINKKGFAHIAFEVNDVEEVLYKVIENGGGQYGSMEEYMIDGVGKIKVVYALDPEGNIIELQSWDKPSNGEKI